MFQNLFQVNIQRMNLMDYHVYSYTEHSLNLYKHQRQMPVRVKSKFVCKFIFQLY